jgi:hypothetical protein
MTDSIPLWTRDSALDSEREAHVMLVCFAAGPLRDDVPFVASQFGAPSPESVAQVELRQHLRESAPEWFDGWRSGACRTIAEHQLEAALPELDAADRCTTIELCLPEPPDLGYLQTAWALARWLVARGAAIVLDVHAARYLQGSELPPPDAELEIEREVSLIFESDPTEPGGGHVLHTRGMKKLARPDIVAVCDPDDEELFADVLWQLADGMARGFLPELPRQGVDLDEETTLYLVQDAGDELAEKLGLNNDARLLVDEDGNSLCSGA